MKKDSPLLNKSFDLGVLVVKLCQKINHDKKEFVLSKQLLRSGTSPGAMIREAQKAESKADFIHKLKIAEKESAETQYWLELMLKTDIITIEDFKSTNDLCVEVSKMLSSAITTLKKTRN
ncbi:four helix bundle protein [Saprospiraceae bacterium]|nr:four helix bundle protein [Saprospiraceae bacterium]